MLKFLKTFFLLAIISFSTLSFADENGLQDLGTLPRDDQSIAYGVSGDGNVVVGESADFFATKPFMWTEESGMVSLMGGPDARMSGSAYAANHDGSVIVGSTHNARGLNPKAFKWTAATGMQSLGNDLFQANSVSADGSVIVGAGLFNNMTQAYRWENGAVQCLGTLGGEYSEAYDVSKDGQVVVGISRFDESQNSHAFRWTAATAMQDLGTLPGGTNSFASATNLDGTIIVGASDTAGSNGNPEAFIWNASTNTLVSLGLLPGGSFSMANDVSSDGTVVVGQADNENGTSQGIRWTQGTGMQTIEQWLSSHNVPITPGTPTTLSALGTNCDGSVVVGLLDNYQAFIARVDPNGSGLTSLLNLNTSLTNMIKTPMIAFSSAKLVLHGSHENPLNSRIRQGRNGFWISGDWGHFNNRPLQNGPILLAEVGLAHLFENQLQLGVGLGKTHSVQRNVSNSKMTLDGEYFIAEAIKQVLPDLWFTLTGYYFNGHEKIIRGYTDSNAIASYGQPDITVPALRARLDLENIFVCHNVNLTPYFDLSYFYARVKAYREQNGSFPAYFTERRDHATQARLGVNSRLCLECFDVLGTIEVVHQFEKTSIGVNGNVIGLFAFRIPGQKLDRNWLRAGIGVEKQIGKGYLIVNLNGSTKGMDPRVWLAAAYRVNF